MWQFVALFVVAIVVSVALRPKPQVPKKAGLEEFDFPTASIGREIPVVFGTKLLKSPNVVWFGDLGAEPIKKKAGGK